MACSRPKWRSGKGLAVQEVDLSIQGRRTDLHHLADTLEWGLVDELLVDRLVLVGRSLLRSRFSIGTEGGAA